MKKESRKSFSIAGCMLTAFALWTAAVQRIDVQAVGPQGTEVGFASVNQAAHDLIGVHMALYTLTDWLSLVPLMVVLGFALLGLTQWIRRKDLRKVDYSILVLGGFYILVMVLFLLFELLEVNYRPVLIDGKLEASYPSSTTMLVMCVIPTAAMQLRDRVQNHSSRRFITPGMTGFLLFMVIGRLISGVHWITDIIGGALLSAGLVMLYHAAVSLEAK